MLDKLFGKSKRESGLTDEDLVGAEVCPNCWGHQEYEGQYVEYVADQTKAAINNDKGSQKAFIAQFVQDRITGIRLKRENDKLVCQKCNTGFPTN